MVQCCHLGTALRANGTHFLICIIATGDAALEKGQGR